MICAQESELVAGLLQEPHERCISPGSSRGETGLNYSTPNPNIGISANPNVGIKRKKKSKFQESYSALLVYQREDEILRKERLSISSGTLESAPHPLFPFSSPSCFQGDRL